VSGATSPQHFELLIILGGSGMIAVGSSVFAYERAHVWLMPAALGAYTVNPSSPTSLLRTYVPSSITEFTDQLQSAGISSAEISRLVHS
jgi:hypothetical protein